MLFLLSPPRFGSQVAPDASSIHARGKVEEVVQSWLLGAERLEMNGRRRPFSVLGYASMRITCENVFSGRKYLLYSHR